MNTCDWISWIESFFNELEVYEDINNHFTYKQKFT